MASQCSTIDETNDSYEPVLISESNTYSVINVIQITNKWLINLFFLVNQNK